MDNPSKEYLEGEERASEEEAGISRPGPLSNPYDQIDQPNEFYDFDMGYKTYIANRNERHRVQRQEQGSWYSDDDGP